MGEVKTRISIGLLGLLWLGLAVDAGATPANKSALARHFGKFLPAKLNSCATCHVRAEPNGAESLKDFPHHAFGKRLRALGDKLTIAAPPHTTPAALQRPPSTLRQQHTTDCKLPALLHLTTITIYHNSLP